ncbi:MAG TPA: alpha/beta hydrolase [Ktedonobacterales bacterium]|nr:alpha/beta hydrolase [Ktedonobacterales bacterium]
MNTSAQGSGHPTGESLVFIHGSGDTAHGWDGVIERLERLGAGRGRTMAVDLPGHGAQARVSMDGLDTVSDYAQVVCAEIDRAGLGAVTLVGHSLGSAIALQLAVDRPERVRRLVLIGGGARLRVLPALLETARTQPAAALRQITLLAHAPEHAALAEAYLVAGGPTAADALYRDLRACDRFDVTGELAGVRQPTLVLVGTEDRLTPPKYARFLAEHLAQSTLVEIAGAGHQLMHEAPDQVASAIGSWL